ncbi:MAG TPA: hypothetical protein VFH48_05010 [Chloroflexota bacterium]|nr:hypothetical protein [Chloroflexota bacterium]
MVATSDPILDVNEPYFQFDREERQFCAMLAHLLMQRGCNLRAFLRLIRERQEERGLLRLAVLSDEAVDRAQVYVEFAILRDRWSQFDADRTLALSARNDQKRAFIQKLFRRVSALERFAEIPLPADVPAAFNAQFMGNAGRRVASDVASPALWRVDALRTWAERVADGADAADVFRGLCILGWAFRIKPDLVVWLPGPTWLCIEAKLLSPEGQYPTGTKEKALFDEICEPGRRRVRQIELQKFLFDTVLGQEAVQVFIGRGARIPRDPASGPSPTAITWREVFNALDLGASQPFVASFIKKNAYVDAPTGTGTADNPDVPDRTSYFDGTEPDLASLQTLLAARRTTGRPTEIGFVGGAAALHKRDLQALEARDWKWRDPSTNTGRHQVRNWIAADAFERIIDELKSEQAVD